VAPGARKRRALRAPFDSEELSDFVGALAPLNPSAEASRGFVWRLPAAHTPFVWRDQLILANVSVWESYEALHEFTYRSMHGRFVRKRTSWFERMDGHTTALWWVREGTRPSMGAALVRLKLVNTYGPSSRAFSLLHQFDSSGRRARRRDR
jgi:hypothetical protein